MKRRRTISKYNEEKLDISKNHNSDSKAKNKIKRKMTSALALSMFVNATNGGGYTNDI